MSASAIQGELLCPVCDSGDVSDCIRIPQVPVYCNVLHEDREAALRAPKGDIDLRFCHRCGHLFNAAFDPGRVDYSSDYENSLHFSGRFREYARALAEHLIELHGLRDKTVIEIACGQGDFLGLLCSLGGNRGIGFDPGHVPGRSDASTGAKLTFIPDYYSEAYSDQRADLIFCRHALEHIDRPGDFLGTVRRAIGKYPTAVFFEVPNALFTLRDLGIWDIVYEHCGYFSEGSLREVFRRTGFKVDRIETGFGDQFLALHASPAREETSINGRTSSRERHSEEFASKRGSDFSPTLKREPVVPTPDARANFHEKSSGFMPAGAEQPTGLAEMVHHFADHYRAKVEGWGETLRRLHRDGSRTVLWGAGSKGVSFVNVLAVTEEIGCLVDLNPYKDGRFVPGTGHQVRAPAFLAEFRPDAVIVMNPLYAEEIGRDLGAMGLSPELLLDEPQ